MHRSITTSAALGLFSLMLGCEPEKPDPDDTGDSDPEVEHPDRDGDGVTADLDCDDRDPLVFPGAVDVCNGRDDDCDDSVDEDPDILWYLDSDGDGFGQDGTATGPSCEQPEGYASNHSDCDDGDAGAYPGAIETCDGRDNDCDGVADDGASTHVDPWGRSGASGSTEDPLASIQEAIDSGAACVSVGPGTYWEQLQVRTGPLWLYSEAGSYETAVDGSYSGRPLTVTARASSGEIVISGLTLQNGYSDLGGGLALTDASVAFSDLRLLSNQANSNGGGIYLYQSTASFDGLDLTGNYGWVGGGLYAEASTLDITSLNAVGNYGGYGAGLALSSCESVIASAVIENNIADYMAGGLYAYDGSLSFQDGAISANQSSQDMGAGAFLGYLDVDISNSTIENNTASITSGGGLALYGATLQLRDSTVRGNTAWYGMGGGILAQQGSSIWVEGVSVQQNRVNYGSGGGIALLYSSALTGSDLELSGNVVTNSSGGGFLAEESCYLELSDVELSSNSANSFGAGIVDNSIAYLTATRVLANSATYVGGLGARDGGDLYVTNSTFEGNTDTGSSGYGTALTAYNEAYLSLSYSTVVGSHGSYAIRVYSRAYLNLDDSIVAFNDAYGLELSSTTAGYLTGGYNDFYGNPYGNIYYNSEAQSKIEGNSLARDPLFVSYTATPGADDLHLGEGSPCIDAGDPSSSDADGSAADMGAYGGPGGSW